MKRKDRMAMNKMIDHIVGMIGIDCAGMCIALMCDCFDKFVEGVDERDCDKIRVTINEEISEEISFGGKVYKA